jgi:hypothetical protein
VVSVMFNISVTQGMAYNHVLFTTLEFVCDEHTHMGSKCISYIAALPAILLFIEYRLIEESCCRIHAVGYHIASYCDPHNKGR